MNYPLRSRVLALPLPTRWLLFVTCWATVTVSADLLLAAALLPLTATAGHH